MGVCRRQTNMSLFDLQRRFKNKTHIKPQWQRGDVWSKQKREEFEKAVREKAARGSDILTGCVILYTTLNDPTTVYISDGLQRTLNSGRIYERLVEQLGDKDAESILNRVSVPVLEMEYRDEKEAKDEFRRVNQGTPLTPMEEAKTILTDLPNYEDWEHRIFSPLHQRVSDVMNQFGVKQTNSRCKKHHRDRDDYGLFLRYISEDKTTTKYTFDTKGIESETKRHNILEQRLVDKLASIKIDQAEKKLTSFGKFLEDESAYIKSIWTAIPKDNWQSEIQTLTAVCLRFLLHVAIFRKNKSIPVERYAKFVERFLMECKGTSYVRYADGGYAVISMGDIPRLPRIQQKLDCVMDPELKPSLGRKRVNTSQLLPGMHNAHKTPFSKNPDGDDGVTVPMPAVKNVSMGTRTEAA